MSSKSKNKSLNAIGALRKVATPPYVSVVEVEGGGHQLLLSLERAPRPNKSYTAAQCELRAIPNGYTFLFSEFNPTIDAAKNCLCVQISDVSLVNVWLNSKEFSRGLNQWMERTYGELFSSPLIDRSPDIVTVAANMAFMGQQGGEIVLAFYNFDPRTARAIAQQTIGRNHDWVNPVVQVFTTVQAVIPMLKQLEDEANKLMQKYPRITEVYKRENSEERAP